jgi:hypothetical protein
MFKEYYAFINQLSLNFGCTAKHVFTPLTCVDYTLSAKQALGGFS